MKTVSVLAVHGVPPRDFPPSEPGGYFGLHARFLRQHAVELLNARVNRQMGWAGVNSVPVTGQPGRTRAVLRPVAGLLVKMPI